MRSKVFLLSFSLILSASMIAGAFVYKTRIVNATIGSNGMLIFGGRIQMMQLCCNGLRLQIGPPVEADVIFTWPISQLYMWWNLTMGQCVLGDAYPFGVCVSPFSWPPCTRSETVDGTIRQVGTTLTGPLSGTCQRSGGLVEGGGYSGTSF